MTFIFILLSFFLLSVIISLYFPYFCLTSKQKRFIYIADYKFPPAMLKRVQAKHDYLTPVNMEKVEQGLRDYFYICNQADGEMVAMPSEIVDVAWHEFLLFTRDYQQFCQKAIGRFLHHTPTEAMKSKVVAQTGIKRAWRLACAKENIDPKSPTRLPLLFAIDKELKIKGGFSYQLNCQSKSIQTSSCGGYCATDIGCASGCGGGGCGGGGCGGE